MISVGPKLWVPGLINLVRLQQTWEAAQINGYQKLYDSLDELSVKWNVAHNEGERWAAREREVGGREGAPIAIKTERVDPDKEFSLVFTVG